LISFAFAISTATVADAKKTKKGNIWTRSKNFKKLTDWAFKTIDADGSGQVDKKELYTGLLMIHLKLATYAGPAACRPATREYCEKIFDEMDVDKSGELDRSEFEEVMQIVCAQVFTRVSIQWTMTLMIVPMSELPLGVNTMTSEITCLSSALSGIVSNQISTSFFNL